MHGTFSFRQGDAPRSPRCQAGGRPPQTAPPTGLFTSSPDSGPLRALRTERFYKLRKQQSFPDFPRRPLQSGPPRHHLKIPATSGFVNFMTRGPRPRRDELSTPRAPASFGSESPRPSGAMPPTHMPPARIRPGRGIERRFPDGLLVVNTRPSQQFTLASPPPQRRRDTTPQQHHHTRRLHAPSSAESPER